MRHASVFAIAGEIAILDVFLLIASIAACNDVTTLRHGVPQLEVLVYLLAIALFLTRMWRLHAGIEAAVFTRLPTALPDRNKRSVTDILTESSWPAATVAMSSMLLVVLTLIAAYDGLLPGLIRKTSYGSLVAAWMFGAVNAGILVFCVKTDTGDRVRHAFNVERHARQRRRPIVPVIQYGTLPADEPPPLPPLPLGHYVILDSSDESECEMIEYAL